MQNKNIPIIQGTQHSITIYRDDSTATDVDFIMKNDDTDVIITLNAVYDAGIAVIQMTGLDTAVIGVYSYQINENTPTGKVKYTAFDCDGSANCVYPKVLICAALDGAVS